MEDRLENVLQGDSWNGHPAHPAFVALPIGMWCLGATLDFISLFTKNECIREAADDAVTLGLAGAALSAVTGLAEYGRVPRDDEAKRMALTHAVINVSSVALNSVNAIIRNGRRGAGRPGGMLPRLLSWTTMGLITYSGWLGGNLVFNHGTGVDTSRRARREHEATAQAKTRTEMKKQEEKARVHA